MNRLKRYLLENGIPSMIYYPLPLHEQKAYKEFMKEDINYPVSSLLCNSVLSIPMHTHLNQNELEFIVDH